MKQPFVPSVCAALIFMLVLFAGFAIAGPGRWEQNLSGGNWTLWLDEAAVWVDDPLFPPPVDIASLSVNPPSCGWDAYALVPKRQATVPGTVEEYAWGSNGNPIGRAGDWRGISWWSTSFDLPADLRGKRIILAFEAANLRAEVFLNRRLVGYDVVGNTPFEADATAAAVFGGTNRLDIRITDPGGNFSWPAHIVFSWGDNTIPIVRGFGGITGAVRVLAVDAVRIADVAVLNRPAITTADVTVTLENTSGSALAGTLTLAVHEYENPDAVLTTATRRLSCPPGESTVSFTVSAKKAKVWGLFEPNLYTARATFTAESGDAVDTFGRRFGFRWFDIREVDGDKRLYLNGKRVFMLATVNRGYWPTNGIFATEEYARKDIETSIAMGYNAVAYHNAIGDPVIVRMADEYGLLATGESGGYRINDSRGRPVEDELTRTLRREKLRRFIIRDRSCPSVIAYMLKNEDSNPPDTDDERNMAMVRDLDPSRILLYTGDCDRERREFANANPNPLKLFYQPYDSTAYWRGWFDKHHWNPVAGWIDDYYKDPNDFHRLNVMDLDPSVHVPPEEVIFYGEEGAFGTMFRLGAIRETILRQGSTDGWREREHLDWYEAYDRWLEESGMRASFPTVDRLTLAFGETMHYYHGHVLENCRISNVVDAYNLNGWASAATHTDMADVYRNPTGDPGILARYARPLYVAVKLRETVMPLGRAPVADIWLVNEKNVRGRHDLSLALVGPDGKTAWSDTRSVQVAGGETFGQLLWEGVKLPAVTAHGGWSLRAQLRNGKEVVTDGADSLFAVDYRTGPSLPTIAVIDTSGAVASLLKEARGITPAAFDPSGPRPDVIVVGAHNFDRIRRGTYDAVMEQVADGALLVVLDQAEQWAEMWDDVFGYQAVQYNGFARLGSGGRFFAGRHPLLDGLPQAQAFGWEYQCCYRNGAAGLDLGPLGIETAVGLAAQNRKNLYIALARIPFGRGTIVASTLDLLPAIASDAPQGATAKRLVMNMIVGGN